MRVVGAALLEPNLGQKTHLFATGPVFGGLPESFQVPLGKLVSPAAERGSAELPAGTSHRGPPVYDALPLSRCAWFEVPHHDG